MHEQSKGIWRALAENSSYGIHQLIITYGLLHAFDCGDMRGEDVRAEDETSVL